MCPQKGNADCDLLSHQTLQLQQKFQEHIVSAQGLTTAVGTTTTAIATPKQSL